MSVTIHYSEHKYGKEIPSEQKIKTVSSLEDVFKWLISLDKSHDKHNMRLLGEINGWTSLGVDFSTKTFGQTYLLAIDMISGDEGVYFKNSPRHVSKQVKELCKKTANEIKKPNNLIE